VTDEAAMTELHSILESTDDVDEVLIVLGMAHVAEQRAAEEDKDDFNGLVAAAMEAATRLGVPREVQEVVKKNAELGRFVEP